MMDPCEIAVSKSNSVSTHPSSTYQTKWYQVANSTSSESHEIASNTCQDVIGSVLEKDTPVLTIFSPVITLRVKVLETSTYIRSSLKQRTDNPAVR